MRQDSPTASLARPWRIVARAVATLVLVAAFGFGGRALYRNVVESLRRPPASVFSTSFRKQLAVVESVAPSGARLLHVSHEGYLPASWQRALYPRNPVRPVFQPSDLEPSSLQQIRKQFGARYAISAGNPLVDPGFLWYRVLDPIPGTGETRFGEIAP